MLIQDMPKPKNSRGQSKVSAPVAHNTANWNNRTLFHGDNLEFMRAMNSCTVDLIATDPPFNKGKDFHATPDSLAAGASFQDRWSWDNDVHQEWTDQIKDDHPKLWEAIESAKNAHSDAMGAYICFMAVRLLEMHRLLKPTGSIYLHCDQTASHYLKAIMDAIFGWKNYINEIIWHYDGPQRPSKRKFGFKHDTIFRYGKSKEFFSDEDAIFPFRALSDEDLKRFKKTPNGLYYYTTPTGDYTKDSIDRLEKEGRIEYTKGGNARVRHFLPIVNNEFGRKKQLPDVWSDIVSLGHAGGRQKVGFPTQKPISLYRRLIEVGCPPNGVILDPFAGCATTLVAAEDLQRKWVGIDIWAGAEKVVHDRMTKEVAMLGKIFFEPKLPTRTDGGGIAAPFLQVKVQIPEPPGPRWSREKIYNHLIQQYGSSCQGCDRVFDDQRYLELDHNTPRSDGGVNHVSNRILLCRPCNSVKSNIYTLSGLRKENKKRGYMAK